jgi:uncharacterized protein (DUF58 family)
VWLGPRAYVALAVIAVLFGCAPGLAILRPTGIVLSCGLLVAFIVDAIVGPKLRSFTVHRILPEHFALRSPAAIGYEIENASVVPIRVGISEAPMRTLRGDGDAAVTLVPAKSRITVTRTMLPVARGTDRFGSLYVWFEGSTGLLRRQAVIGADQPLRVYPDLSAVQRYGTLHARNRAIEAGLRRMRLRGIGSEFESLRDYAPGDAFRTVDWKATARRGKLMVTHREVERSQDVMLLLDCGRLMTPRLDEQRKLDYAVTAALSLASIAALASDRVGIVAFAQDILVARSPRSTAASVNALADALCDVEPRFEEADYAHAFSYLRSHLHRRSLIVLFTDAIDPVAQSTVLAELSSLAKRHVVLCVLMNDEAVLHALSIVPTGIEDAYAAGVALGLDRERRTAGKTLERLGIGVIDVPARQLSVAAIDAYLRIKARGQL